MKKDHSLSHDLLIGLAILFMINLASFSTSASAKECADYTDAEKARYPSEWKHYCKDYTPAPAKVCLATPYEVLETTYDTKCGKDSLMVSAQNMSPSEVRLKICIKNINGNWDCGSEGPVKFGDQLTYWSCKPEGSYVVQSYKFNKDIYSCFPKDKDTRKPDVPMLNIRRAYR